MLLYSKKTQVHEVDPGLSVWSVYVLSLCVVVFLLVPWFPPTVRK